MLKFRWFLLLAAMISTASAHALLITPDDAIDFGPENRMNQIRAVLSAEHSLTSETFEYTTEGEAGGAAHEYEVTFSNTISNPSDALIEWMGEGYLMGATHMLVKDGNHDPGWYLFDISGWDGMETIELNAFWPAGGAISNIRMYGGVSVPEPETLAMFALGLVALFGTARRKRVG